MAPEEPIIWTSSQTQPEVWELTVCVELAGWRGKQEKQRGNIWNDQSYQDIRVEIGFILMDFGFRIHAAMLLIFIIKWWKKIFLMNAKYIYKLYLFFKEIILLLHLFRWNEILKWKENPRNCSWGCPSPSQWGCLMMFWLLTKYLQGCFAAYNSLHSETISRQCLVESLVTLQTWQVMDITGTHWQHSRPPTSLKCYKAQPFGKVGMFWQSESLNLERFLKLSASLWFLKCPRCLHVEKYWEILEDWVRSEVVTAPQSRTDYGSHDDARRGGGEGGPPPPPPPYHQNIWDLNIWDIQSMVN